MAGFEYAPPFPPYVANDKSTFARTFEHHNWVDGQDVVQAGETPDEKGMNARLNALEADLDAVKADLVQSYQLVADLRVALATALGQIQSELNKKTDKSKEGKDAKDGKETKETKDHKDGKETKETKEDKDGKEGLNAAEKSDLVIPPREQAPHAVFLDEAHVEPVGRAFIRPDERPRVGERILAREPVPSEPVTPAAPAP